MFKAPLLSKSPSLQRIRPRGDFLFMRFQYIYPHLGYPNLFFQGTDDSQGCSYTVPVSVYPGLMYICGSISEGSFGIKVVFLFPFIGNTITICINKVLFLIYIPGRSSYIRRLVNHSIRALHENLRKYKCL